MARTWGTPIEFLLVVPQIYHATEFFVISTEKPQQPFSATKDEKVDMSIGDISYTIDDQDVAQTNGQLYLFTH